MGTGNMKWLLAGGMVMLASCAFITVNIYFPEKEVKKAFKTLDEKYLKQDDGTAPPDEKGTEGDGAKPESMPQSRLDMGSYPVFLSRKPLPLKRGEAS